MQINRKFYLITEKKIIELILNNPINYLNYELFEE